MAQGSCRIARNGATKNNQSSNYFARIAKEVRDSFEEFFNFVQGSVPWQDKVVNSTIHAFDQQY